MRIDRDVTRGEPIVVLVDGKEVPAFAGETIATAMVLHSPIFRHDTRGQPRGMFCNMGTCSECLVTLLPDRRRIRACITPATDGMEIETHG
jgi:aerobic-type carbon monoxide dehydrogenase small subunit (CoxS/CutS family)